MPSITVDELIQALDHPLLPAIELLRATILAAHPEIGEGVKWNSPSYYFQSPATFFATINTRPGPIRLIFHQGAKTSGAPKPEILDSKGLLEWLGKDRCSMTFHDSKQVKANKSPIQDIVRQWVAAL